MQGKNPRRFLAVVAVAALVAVAGAAGEVHSTMRNVNAVVEAQGFSIQPVYDVEATRQSTDLSPPQVFEIIRPPDKSVTIGRLFTSCSCIQLETHKRFFKPGERAILQLRNIRPTPASGQVYAIFVQISSPVRATLRFDTFVKTETGDSSAHNPAAANHEPAEDITDHPPEEVEVEEHAEEAAGSPAIQEGLDENREDLEALLKRQAEGAADELAAAGDGLPDFYNQGTAELATPVPAAEATPSVPAADFTAPVAPASVSTSAPSRDPNARRPVQVVSLITIGVRDMPAAMRFYENLGWMRAARGKYDQTAFFQLQGQVLALYPLTDLLREQNMPAANPSPGGITLALHVADKADVWAVYQRFVDAGGTSLRPPAEMPSGAVSCYVADPDGNAWEISYVPQFRIDEDGGLWLP